MSAAVNLDRDLVFGPIIENNVGILRVINKYTLPVEYTESFYSKVTTASEDFVKYAWFKEMPVAAVCSRLDSTNDGQKLYVMTLGVLPAYQHMGIGTKLINDLLEKAAQTKPKCVAVYLHVWTENKQALAFYEKLGFGIVQTVENYYKTVSPPNALLLQKEIA